MQTFNFLKCKLAVGISEKVSIVWSINLFTGHHDSWIILNGGTRKQITHTSCPTSNQLLIDSWVSDCLVLCYELVGMMSSKAEVNRLPQTTFLPITVLAWCQLMEITELCILPLLWFTTQSLIKTLGKISSAGGVEMTTYGFCLILHPFVTCRFNFFSSYKAWETSPPPSAPVQLDPNATGCLLAKFLPFYSHVPFLYFTTLTLSVC